jgi:hypothetical protein
LLSDHRPVVGVYEAQLIYNPIGYQDLANIKHRLVKLDIIYAEIQLDINHYFDELADYVPRSKIAVNTELHLMFELNDYILNQNLISGGTSFPTVSDPNRKTYTFNFRGKC